MTAKQTSLICAKYEPIQNETKRQEHNVQLQMGFKRKLNPTPENSQLNISTHIVNHI